MNTKLTAFKNRVIHFFYQNVSKPIFFSQDPEDVHDRITRLGELMGKTGAGRFAARALFDYQDSRLEQTVAGIRFRNPVGLAAGFDKDAHLVDVLPSVGFGFEEIGSVTGEPCAGNPKPRLWRLKQSRSLLVYYGLKNDGAEAVSARLQGRRFAIPLGVSIAKTNCPAAADDEAGIADYVKAYRTFVEKGIGDYFTINISCPNAFGGEPFTTPEKFDRLMAALRQVSSDKPVFVKMPAEMDESVIDGMLEIARKHRVAGFISSNLAKSRENQSIRDTGFPDVGGMSGKVVEDLANRQIEYLFKQSKGEFVIVGCGGVFSAEDAYRKIKLGASLVQMITGMIYEGPQVVGEINRGLAELLERDGYSSVTQAIGSGVNHQ